MTFVHTICLDQFTAERAVEELVESGFPSTDIGALLCARRGDEVEELKIKHMTGVGVGAPLGAAIGMGIGALVASIGLLTGPLGMVINGLLVGGALGALLGTLAGLGVWREKIEFPSRAFEEGAVLLGVNTHEARIDDAKHALERAGADIVRIASTMNPREQLRTGASDS